MKHGFCASALIRESTPARIPHACRAVSAFAFTHEIHPGVRHVSGPMLMEVVEKRHPVALEPVRFEITERKRKGVIDAYQHWRAGAQLGHEPFSNGAAGPVFTWTFTWEHLVGHRAGRRHVDAQTGQARLRRLRARVIDPDHPGEPWAQLTPSRASAAI